MKTKDKEECVEAVEVYNHAVMIVKLEENKWSVETLELIEFNAYEKEKEEK